MFKNTKLIKLLSLNSLSVFVKLIAGFVSAKAIAYFLGPSAMALLGNFKNFTTTIQRVSTLGFQSGVVKYVSEFEDDLKRRSQVFNTALLSSGIISVVLATFIIVGSSFISNYIFHTDEYATVIKVFGLVLPFYILHMLILNTLNGLKQFKSFIRISIVASLFSTLFSVFLIWTKQIQGALFAVASTEGIIIIFSFYFLKKIGVTLHKKYFSKSLLVKLLTFSTMALFSAIIDPNVNLYLRKLIIGKYDLFQAGIWESVNRFSNYYLLFVTSSLSLYYFPKLAETQCINNFQRIIKKYYQFVLPILVIGGLVLYFGRYFFIQLLFGKEFLSMETYFLPRLIGDSFKILSYGLSYQFLAKRMLKMYLFTEVLFFVVYLIASVVLIKQFDVLGVVYAYAIAYFVYWLFVLLFFADKFRKTKVIE